MDFVMPSKDKDFTIPRFYVKAVKNGFKSTQEGREIFEDKEYVEIMVPGNRGTIVDEKVRDEHRNRWPREYDAFKRGTEAPLIGTPVEEWAAIGPSQANELKYAHVRTVEQLAALDDNALSKVVPMGGQALRQKAQMWLEQAKGNAPLEKMQAENASLREAVDMLQQQMAELGKGKPSE